MARESKKSSASVAEGHSTLPKAKARAATSSSSASATPEGHERDRAPSRGKYDRTRTPDEREKEQRHRLLDAAGHVFAEMGWADATVEAIVSRAGMSRRTFYEHFDDLKDCLQAFHERAARRALKWVEMSMHGAGSSPSDQLRVGITGFLAAIGSLPDTARVLFRVVRSAGPDFEAAHEQLTMRFGKLVYDSIEAAHEAGQTALPPDELRVFALVSALEAVAMRYVLAGEFTRAVEAAPIIIDMTRRVFGHSAPASTA